MKRSPLLVSLLLGLAVLGASCSLTTTVKQQSANTKSVTTNTVTNTTATAKVAYAGQTGKNALELLQSGHTVDASAQGFVNAIDGVKPGEHEFWAFYVNAKQAAVGAKDYQTKDGETIEWKLEKF